MRTDCGVIHGPCGTCSSYQDLPPLMIQRHEQQLGGGRDDDGKDDGGE